jgi:uncharacterized membrane protein YcaP (DUF421 family)
MLFGGWHSLLRIFVMAICCYAALVVLLRVFGKRTLAQFNAFDFIVTVALGSTLASALLTKDVTLADGVTAFAMLMLLQFAVTWLCLRVPLVDRVVKSEPRLLFYADRFIDEALARERVTQGEVIAAVRDQGIASLDQVEAVVMETAGKLSVIRKSDGRPSTIENVSGLTEATRRDLE